MHPSAPSSFRRRAPSPGRNSGTTPRYVHVRRLLSLHSCGHVTVHRRRAKPIRNTSLEKREKEKEKGGDQKENLKNFGNRQASIENRGGPKFCTEKGRKGNGKVEMNGDGGAGCPFPRKRHHQFITTIFSPPSVLFCPTSSS